VIKGARQTALATKVPETLRFSQSNYNNPNTRVNVTIFQVNNSRTHQFSSGVNFIQIRRGAATGAFINQIRFNGFGIPQAFVGGAWQNTNVLIRLNNYGVDINPQGLSNVCASNANFVSPSIPACI
jgi:hypothetical protein